MGKVKYQQEDLTGMTFSYWTVLGEAERYQQVDGHTSPRVLVLKCRCGTVRSALAANVLRGRSKSCGCLQKETASDVTKQRWEKYRQQHE